MRAIICDQFGPINNLHLGDLPDPVPQANEVLIEVAACGVNYPDLLIVQGRYQFRPDLPFSPGGEVSGRIVGLGTNVKHFKLGDRVLAAMGWGGYATQVVAPVSQVFRIPEDVSDEQAACLLETYATALYALKDRALLNAGERLVVLGGAGGTGTAAIQLGKLFGAEVVAVASTPEKRQFCLNQGAKLAFSPEEASQAMKSMGGSNVIFDPVGGALSEAMFRTLLPGGRHLVVGFASGEIPTLPWNLPLLKSASIVGVFWGHFWRHEPENNHRNVRMLLKWLEEDRISPVIQKLYPLAEAVMALQQLQDRKVLGKVVLKP